MKVQGWAFLASIGTAVLSAVALLGGDLPRTGLWGVAAAALWMSARIWNRRSPAPFPYALRWLLRLPRLCQSPRQLQRVLQPRRGEHLLEIGPGIGTHALPVASSLAPDGVLEVLDLQREMLDEIIRRAKSRGLTNIIATEADAAGLPYPDATFDGAYLIGVLGEIPDHDAALRELRRVLKPRGRLVVEELGIDPDLLSLGCRSSIPSERGSCFKARSDSRSPTSLASSEASSGW